MSNIYDLHDQSVTYISRVAGVDTYKAVDILDNLRTMGWEHPVFSVLTPDSKRPDVGSESTHSILKSPRFLPEGGVTQSSRSVEEILITCSERLYADDEKPVVMNLSTCKHRKKKDNCISFTFELFVNESAV